MIRWLRRRRKGDDHRLTKFPDPIEELDRLIREARQRDADDEDRLDDFMRSDKPSSYSPRKGSEAR